MNTMRDALNEAGINSLTVAQMVNAVYDAVEQHEIVSPIEQRNTTTERINRMVTFANPNAPSTFKQRASVAGLTRLVSGAKISPGDASLKALTQGEISVYMDKLLDKAQTLAHKPDWVVRMLARRLGAAVTANTANTADMPAKAVLDALFGN